MSPGNKLAKKYGAGKTKTTPIRKVKGNHFSVLKKPNALSVCFEEIAFGWLLTRDVEAVIFQTLPLPHLSLPLPLPPLPLPPTKNEKTTVDNFF